MLQLNLLTDDAVEVEEERKGEDGGPEKTNSLAVGSSLKFFMALEGGRVGGKSEKTKRRERGREEEGKRGREREGETECEQGRQVRGKERT